MWVIATLTLALTAPAYAQAQDGAEGSALEGEDTSSDPGEPDVDAPGPPPPDTTSPDTTSPDTTSPDTTSPESTPPESTPPESTWSGEPEEEPAQLTPAPSSPTVVHVHTAPTETADEEEEEEEEEPSPFDPHEREGDQLYHFGVFVRGIFVPQYGQNFFVEGGNDALLPAGGAFFNYRQNNLNFQVEVWGASFFNQAPYHGRNETEFETEWIESELRVLFVSLVVSYSLPITSWLAIEIGGGLGFGGVFGDLWRTEAYPDPNARAGWTPCASPADPADPAPMGRRFCDSPAPAGEGSYQRQSGESEPYNFEGGVPPLWFWIEIPRVAIRFKPIRQLQLRAEAGFALYGFHFGASAAIGF